MSKKSRFELGEHSRQGTKPHHRKNFLTIHNSNMQQQITKREAILDCISGMSRNIFIR
jgi:hypothetical protein